MENAPSHMSISGFIKHTALEIGFDACGIAKADFLKEDAQALEAWLQRGHHAQMGYLERNFEKRTDPRLLVEGCQSVIVTLMNYFPSQFQRSDAPRISKYAYSKVDYHTILKEKLLLLEQKIVETYGAGCFNAKQQHRFVDSAPLLERRWAQRAGLGWIGKNKMLINPSLGSFCFIGLLLINKQLEYDTPMPDRCGKCTRCIDSCPTRALSLDGGLNAVRCISYQTIENKGSIPAELHSQLSGYVYGCDICNDVCPWNKTRAKATNCPEFEILNEIIQWNDTDWAAMTETDFNRIFNRSAVRRAGFVKLKENLRYDV